MKKEIGKHEQKFWNENPDFKIKQPKIRNEVKYCKTSNHLNYSFSLNEIIIKKEDIINALKLQNFYHISINVHSDRNCVVIENCNAVSFEQEKYDKFLTRELEINEIMKKWRDQNNKLNAARSKDAMEKMKDDEYENYLKLKQKYEGPNK